MGTERQHNEEEPPLGVYELGGIRLYRDLGCAAILLLPSLLAIPLFIVDLGRTLAALGAGLITGLLIIPLFGTGLRRDLATRVELHRNFIRADTRGGPVVVPWRKLGRVSWRAAGDRWLRSDVFTTDGTRVATITNWLRNGRACAFLIQRGADEHNFPWAYIDAAEWAANGHVDIRATEGGSIESAKSGRSRCRTCNELIHKGELRYGVRVRSPRPKHTTNQWHHLACAKQRFGDEVEAARTPSSEA